MKGDRSSWKRVVVMDRSLEALRQTARPLKATSVQRYIVPKATNLLSIRP